MANPVHGFITTANVAGGDFIHQPDWMQTPFTLAYAIEVPGGITASFSLQYTLDSVADLGLAQNSLPAPAWIPIWLPDPTNGTIKTVTVSGLYTFPIRALRVSVTSLSGTFTQPNGVALTAIRFSALQGMSSR